MRFNTAVLTCFINLICYSIYRKRVNGAAALAASRRVAQLLPRRRRVLACAPLVGRAVGLSAALPCSTSICICPRRLRCLRCLRRLRRLRCLRRCNKLLMMRLDLLPPIAPRTALRRCTALPLLDPTALHLTPARAVAARAARADVTVGGRGTRRVERQLQLFGVARRRHARWG